MPGKKTGTFKERFVKRLAALGGSENEAVTNAALMDSLGWNEQRYKDTKEALLRAKIIAKAKGYGGKVRLLDDSNINNKPSALHAFIAYSHTDREIHKSLLNHLRPLSRIGLIDSWSDREIKPGEEWHKEISTKLNAADIIILLISVDFINSEYCYASEMTRAMERHEEKSAVVIPVIARQCLWRQSPFGKLQALPEGARAIVGFDDLDEAFTSVAEGIRKRAEEIHNKS